MGAKRIGRRAFVASAGLGAAALSVPTTPAVPANRKSYFILSLGRIGFKASFPEAVALAARHGFEGLDPDAGYFASLSDGDLKRLLEELEAKKLRLRR